MGLRDDRNNPDDADQQQLSPAVLEGILDLRKHRGITLSRRTQNSMTNGSLRKNSAGPTYSESTEDEPFVQRVTRSLRCDTKHGFMMPGDGGWRAGDTFDD